ncbi:MFS transporter [Salinicola aestuarinus]|uniref:MFS transporter n=1 Tax=Salinicola aestuarinus TaxID=1949082 RepID=UPI000DA1C516|nr:MFS transporter [Salinicola aestuarinus]
MSSPSRFGASAPSAEPYPAPRQGSLVYYSLLMVTFLAASSAPTPLYQLYQASWGFSTTWLTLVFASYIFALLASLLMTGSLSDHLGRRPVVAAAILGEIVALGLFVTADDLAWLLAARIVQGVATGVATSALAAALLDSDPTRGPLMASIAPLSGMGVGALLAGVLVTYLPAPMQGVYLLLLVLLMMLGVWLLRIPEGVTPRPGALASLRPHASIPSPVRKPLLRVAPAVVASWALGGFSLSLGPTLVETISHCQSPLIGSLITFLLPFVGGISVMVLRSRPSRLAVLLGTACIVVGMLGLLLGVALTRIDILLGGTAVAGIGFGAAFMGALRIVMPLAPPTERSALMAAFYVICYLSASLLALIGGIATQHVGLLPTTYVYGSGVALLSLIAFVATLSQRQAI